MDIFLKLYDFVHSTSTFFSFFLLRNDGEESKEKEGESNVCKWPLSIETTSFLHLKNIYKVNKITKKVTKKRFTLLYIFCFHRSDNKNVFNVNERTDLSNTLFDWIFIVAFHYDQASILITKIYFTFSYCLFFFCLTYKNKY